MIASDLVLGHHINYRGHRAEIVEHWTAESAPGAFVYRAEALPGESPQKLDYAVGIVIEWGESGQTYRCRLLFTLGTDDTCDGLNGPLGLAG